MCQQIVYKQLFSYVKCSLGHETSVTSVNKTTDGSVLNDATVTSGGRCHTVITNSSQTRDHIRDKPFRTTGMSTRGEVAPCLPVPFPSEPPSEATSSFFGRRARTREPLWTGWTSGRRIVCRHYAPLTGGRTHGNIFSVNFNDAAVFASPHCSR